MPRSPRGQTSGRLVDVHRAEAHYATAALRWCDLARDRGLAEPPGLRATAEEITGRQGGSGS